MVDGLCRPWGAVFEQRLLQAIATDAFLVEGVFGPGLEPDTLMMLPFFC